MNLFRFLFNHLTQAAGPRAFMTGIIGATCLIPPLAIVRHSFGGTATEIAALLFSAIAALWGTFALLKFIPSLRQHSNTCLIAAACFALLSPTLAHQLLNSISNFSVITLNTPAMQFSVVACFCMCLIMPAVIANCLAFHELQTSSNNHSRFLMGLGCGIVATGVVALPTMGAAGVSLLALGLTAAMNLWATLQPAKTPSQIAFSQASTQPALSSTISNTTTALHCAVSALTGASIAMMAMACSQLIPRQLMTDSSMLGGIVFAIGLSLFFRKNAAASEANLLARRMMSLGLWTAAFLLAYPLLTSANLYIIAHFSSLNSIVFSRCGILFLTMLPLAMSWRTLQRSGSMQSSAANAIVLSQKAPWQATSLLAGFIIAQMLAQPARVAGLGILANCVVGLLTVWAMNRFAISTSRFRQGWLVTASLFLACGLLFSQRLDPKTSERILFNSHAIKSARQGVSTHELGWMDDSRQVAVFEDLHDRISVSKSRVHHLTVRENGLMAGILSEHQDVSPQNASDILPALLPLAFHPEARDVLILGVQPTVLEVCHTFPLRLVRTMDGRNVAHKMLSWMANYVPNWSLKEGADFQFGRVDPLLSLYAQHDCQYDVLISPVVVPVGSNSTCYLTSEFYKKSSARLKVDGIFSQRIPYYDLSPEMLQQIAANVRSAFTFTRVIEVVPGELVFLSSQSELPAIDESVVNRLKANHTRALLGYSGWDWSMVLARGGLTPEEFVNFSASTQQPTTCWTSNLDCRLSMETSRWGNKFDDARKELAKYGAALHAELKEENLVQDVQFRISDLTLAYELQIENPNDPWGYRAAIKNRLQDRPRTELVQVKNEGLKRVLDGEDRRRKDYLVKLGELAKTSQTTHEDFNALLAYEQPFDPLISLFINHEAVYLMSRSQNRDDQIQYRNLMRSVYYTTPRDQSTRNVSAALEVATSETALPLNSTERFDHLNGLMQILAQRWHLRWESKRTSRYDAIDLERSTKAAEAAMVALAANYEQAGLSQSDWDARRSCLEQILIRPLRQHRSTQLTAAPLTADQLEASRKPPVEEASTK